MPYCPWNFCPEFESVFCFSVKECETSIRVFSKEFRARQNTENANQHSKNSTEFKIDSATKHEKMNEMVASEVLEKDMSSKSQCQIDQNPSKSTLSCLQDFTQDDFKGV